MPEIEKLIWGGRTRRQRDNIIKFLEKVGSADSRQILNHINDKMHSGATMNQIGNSLSKDPRFTRLEDTRIQNNSGGTHTLQRFRLSADYKEWGYRPNRRKPLRN